MDVRSAVDGLIAGLEQMPQLRDHVVAGSQQFAARIESMMAAISPFEQRVLEDRLTTMLRFLEDGNAQTIELLKRHPKYGADFAAVGPEGDAVLLLASAVLPQRGWYLSGNEPCTLPLRLVTAILEENWDQIDSEMMYRVSEMESAELWDWLVREGFAEHSINRLRLCLDHHHAGRFEEATFIGVPLIDEICLHLYPGKAFTTKRNRGSSQRPALWSDEPSAQMLDDVSAAFVRAFGSLQQQTDMTRLSDEDYWNRHAIVHGMMRRPVGIKDSAKCLMAIKFLLCARRESALQMA